MIIIINEDIPIVVLYKNPIINGLLNSYTLEITKNNQWDYFAVIFLLKMTYRVLES